MGHNFRSQAVNNTKIGLKQVECPEYSKVLMCQMIVTKILFLYECYANSLDLYHGGLGYAILLPEDMELLSVNSCFINLHTKKIFIESNALWTRRT